MLMRKILQEPHVLLHRRCTTVRNFKEAKKITKELLSVIKSASKWWNCWLGFAANQIGYSKRIIALRTGKNDYEILVNPIFIEKRFPCPYIETCYSLALKEYYLVRRYLWAKVKYQDLRGVWREKVLRGPSAIYQEIDHCDGIMVSKRGLQIW